MAWGNDVVILPELSVYPQHLHALPMSYFSTHTGAKSWNQDCACT